MPATTSARNGGLRLFRIFGIDVYVHWLWLVAAVYMIQIRRGVYPSIAWNIAEYLTMFGIVLLHEFGHALACRSVGGRADMIMLWLLGGVAVAQPPPRPGAWLWTIAAGPLVNVVLAPLLFGAYFFARQSNVGPDLLHFLEAVFVMNIILLGFNMLPIYPLDGGQIVQCLLWFVVGQAKSLMIASVIGLIGAAGGLLLALAKFHDFWLILIALFAASKSWQAFTTARKMNQFLSLPRHASYHCPACGESPPAVPLWICSCGHHFDMFASNATCPQCGQVFDEIMCLRCRQRFPLSRWTPAGFPVFTPTRAVPTVVPE